MFENVDGLATNARVIGLLVALRSGELEKECC